MGITQLPSGRFRARVQVDGVRHTETFDTHREAADWQTIVRARGLQGHTSSTMTVRTWSRIWLDTYYAAAPANTSRFHDDNLRLHLLPHLGDRKLATLKPTHIQQTIDAIATAVSPARAESALRTLRAMLNDAVDDDVLAASPVRRRHIPKLQPTPKIPLEVVEARHLLLQLTGWHRDTALLLVATGARFSEIAGLTPHDISPTSHEVSIVRRVSKGTVRATKNHRARRVLLAPLGHKPVARLTVQALNPDPIPDLGNREHPADPYIKRWLIQTSTGRPANPSAFGKALKLAAGRAGITKRVHPHLLRHTYVSWMIDAGHTADKIAFWIGDKPETVRRVYAHMLEASSAPAADTIQAALGDLG